MAKMGNGNSKMFTEKKTRQGKGRHTKYGTQGSPVQGGGKVSKGYRKKSRGQG